MKLINPENAFLGVTAVTLVTLRSNPALAKVLQFNIAVTLIVTLGDVGDGDNKKPICHRHLRHLEN